MDTTSPPLTPIRQYMSPLETSPTSSYREHLRRRTSSFSSNHERSPVSVRSKNRFSNASQYSNEFSPDGGGAGLGNLADELDQLDDDDDYEEDATEAAGADGQDGDAQQPSPVDGARDSGIDVSYNASKKNSPRVRNFSKPFLNGEKPPDEEEEEQMEDRLSPELEDLINTIARMAAYTAATEDPLIPRTIALLQDLGNQSTLETLCQRQNTSTNSIASNVIGQGKAIHALSTSLYSPFAFSIAIDADLIDETIPLIEELLKELPLPDPEPPHGLQKLDRETANLIQTLSQLTDTLQMGRQTTNAASRHLRNTENIVVELRRERERAEAAREELNKSNWDDRIRDRWCAGECRDIVGSFERACDSLRETLVQAGATTTIVA